MKNIYITSNGLTPISQVIEFTKAKEIYTTKQFSPRDELVRQNKIKFDSELETFQMSKVDVERAIKVLGNVEPKVSIVKGKIQFKAGKKKLSFNLLQNTYDFNITSKVTKLKASDDLITYIKEATQFTGVIETNPKLASVCLTPTHIMASDSYYFYVKTVETGLTEPLNIEVPNIKEDFKIVGSNATGQTILKYSGIEVISSATGYSGEYPDLNKAINFKGEGVELDLQALKGHISSMNTAGAHEFSFIEDNKLLFKFKESTSQVEVEFEHNIEGVALNVSRLNKALSNIDLDTAKVSINETLLALKNEDTITGVMRLRLF